MNKILVLGCGSWGSALAQSLSENSHSVVMWHYNTDKLINFKKTRIHPNLKNFKFNSKINFEYDLEKSIFDSDVVVIATPTSSVREISKKLNSFIKKNQIIVNTAKGLESGSLLRMSEVIYSEMSSFYNIVSLYGPSHAEEVIDKQPATLVSASDDLDIAKKVQSIFSSDNLRVYTNQDIIGVELGGSLKNVIAIATGICDGIGFGDNTKAALLTRGMAEITRLGEKMGANPSTFSGLSGVGDLIATCLSRHSRNRFVGQSIGEGKNLDEILNSMDMVAEGVNMSRSINDLSKKYNVDMPISKAVYKILFHNKDPKDMVVGLMTRDLIQEKNN